MSTESPYKEEGNATKTKCYLMLHLQLLVHAYQKKGLVWGALASFGNRLITLFLFEGSMFQNQRCLPVQINR